MRKKTALVTGSSRGIGRSIALSLARSGYHVFLNSSRSLEELASVKAEITAIPGGSCDLFLGDAGDFSFVSGMFQKIHETWGALDVLVNNAGISYIGLITDMSEADWNRILKANLSSVFFCCQQATLEMVPQKSGKIVNISSMWGRVGASCEVAYSASKAGVCGLTQALAKELAPSNIQVNAIACGCIDTTMNSHLDEKERKALEESIPAGRFGSPSEVADLVMQLIESPAYLTGQIIGFDGGYI